MKTIVVIATLFLVGCSPMLSNSALEKRVRAVETETAVNRRMIENHGGRIRQAEQEIAGNLQEARDALQKRDEELKNITDRARHVVEKWEYRNQIEAEIREEKARERAYEKR